MLESKGWAKDPMDELLTIYLTRGAATYSGESVTTLEYSLQTALLAQQTHASEVRLHVPAKRYLCATDPEFRRQLSGASTRTLQLQGGPMAETIAFRAEPYYHDAIRLRRWDDCGKVPGLQTPELSDYPRLIGALSR
jgi:predicted HD phosphohydrolase